MKTFHISIFPHSPPKLSSFRLSRERTTTTTSNENSKKEMVVAMASSLLLLSSFFLSFFLSSAQQNDDSAINHHVARAELSTILGKTSAWRTNFNTYDSYSELSEDIGKKHFLQEEDLKEEFLNKRRRRRHLSSDSSSSSENVFTYREWQTKPIDFRVSVSLKLSGFHRDGNFLAKVTKRDIEPFLETVKSDALSEGEIYKMHFHYHVMHARKEVNVEVEKAIQENVRVEREWSSTSKAKNTVDFRKVDGIIEKDNVFGGDDDMTKVYKTEKDDVFSPYVIYALNPRRPKNPNDNKASVQYVYSFLSHEGGGGGDDKKYDKKSSNSSQCFGTSVVSRDDASSSSSSSSPSAPAYAWVDLTSGPNGFTKKRTKFTTDYSRRVPPKVLGAHAKQENVPLLSASIAGFLGDASKTLFAPSIRREFLDEHFGSLSSSSVSSGGKEKMKVKFKTDDAWISHVQIELVRISELPFNLQSERDAKKIDPDHRVEKYLQKALLPGRKIKVNEREVDFNECPLCAQAFKNAMHYSGSNTNTNRIRKSIENRNRNSDERRTSSNSNSSGARDFEEDEEEFLVDESELLFWVEEYEEGIRKQLGLRDGDETTKVIPVFLFDLKLTTHGKLGAFTDGKQAEIAKDNSFIVAVRNSKKHKIDIPSFKCFEDDPTQNAWVDSSDVVRALKASLMTNLFGIHVDVDRDDVDLSWAIGNDVFTPLSAGEGDSFAIIDGAKRTTIAVGMQKIRRFIAKRLEILHDICREDGENENTFAHAFPREPLRKTFLARSRLLKFKHEEAVKATTLREWERAATFVLSSIVDANAMVEALEETIASHKVRLDCYNNNNNNNNNSPPPGGSSLRTTTRKNTKKKKKLPDDGSRLYHFLEAFFYGGFEAFFGTAFLIVSYVCLVEVIAFYRKTKGKRRRNTKKSESTRSGENSFWSSYRKEE